MADKQDSKKIKPNTDKPGSKRKATEEGIVPNNKMKMDETIIKLNVGGELVSTLSSTLDKESKIYNHMSSFDKSDRRFLDCDFDVFKYVLDFLRNENNLPTPEMALEVYDLAKDIECETLVKKLESYPAVKYRNEMEKKRNGSIIELNIGGRLVSTLSSTLNKESKIFNHMSCDNRGRLFLDCDFDVFKYVLDFLRNENNLPTPEMALKVYDLAKNINCETLVKKLESYQAVKYRNEMEKIRESRNENFEGLKQKIINAIVNLNAGPGEGKAIRICSRNVSSSCKEAEDEDFHARDVIVVDVSCDNYYLGDNEFPLLAYDLATLGFEKCAITHVNDICKSCKQWHNWKLIILPSQRREKPQRTS